jgi:hypothetical protein
VFDIGIYGNITTTGDIYSGKDVVTNNGGQMIINSAANVPIKITTTTLAGGSHTPTSQHMPIIIGGTTYYIQLLN